MNYIEYLDQTYPDIKDLHSNPMGTIYRLAMLGDLYGIQAIEYIYSVIDPNGWERIAEIAAKYGYQDIIEYAASQYNLDDESLAVIARSSGYGEIASDLDGYDYVVQDSYTNEYDPFPYQYGPVGIPMEDKGQDVIDWRSSDFSEEMLPEEPLSLEGVHPQFGSLGWGFKDDTLINDEIFNDEFDDPEDEGM